MIHVLIALVLLLSASLGHAAPFVVSDPAPATGTQPTHCGIFLDAAAKAEVAVASDTTGKYCKFDIGMVGIGSHTIKATFIAKDTTWGTLESLQSAPFTFTRPGVPQVPVGLGLAP